MFSHLLIPLDGSELAEVAILPACEIAARFASQITLLRVVAPPFLPGSFGGPEYATMLDSLREQTKTDATQYLVALQQRLQAEGYPVEIIVVEGESVAEEILATVDRVSAEGLVMSTHGRGGIRRWVFGSVADRVLQQAAVPIMLIRTSENSTINRGSAPKLS